MNRQRSRIVVVVFVAFLCLLPLESCRGDEGNNDVLGGEELLQEMVSNHGFGHESLKHFSMDPTYVNLNHGSYGLSCKEASQGERSYYDIMEFNPNTWFHGLYQQQLEDTRLQVSKYVHADNHSLVIVENASAGVNSVLRSVADGLPLGSDDILLHMDIAYPMVKNVASYLASVRNFTIVNIPITFPITSSNDFLAPVKAAIKQYGSKIKIASLDHIASYPSVVLPVKDLIQECHKHDILVMIDGAHTMGQIPLNVTDIGADFYLSDGHKWMYSPKGTAMLWVAKKWEHLIQPTVVSSEMNGDFVHNFQYTGTRDYCPFLAIRDALAFRSRLGDRDIMDYMHQLVWTSANQIAGIWNTSLLVPVQSMNGALASVQLPCSLSEGYAVSSRLLRDYNTYIQLSSFNNVPYVRLSAQIYLELSDFTTMAHRFLDILQNQVRNKGTS